MASFSVTPIDRGRRERYSGGDDIHSERGSLMPAVIVHAQGRLHVVDGSTGDLTEIVTKARVVVVPKIDQPVGRLSSWPVVPSRSPVFRKYCSMLQVSSSIWVAEAGDAVDVSLSALWAGPGATCRQVHIGAYQHQVPERRELRRQNLPTRTTDRPPARPSNRDAALADRPQIESLVGTAQPQGQQPRLAARRVKSLHGTRREAAHCTRTHPRSVPARLLCSDD
jgi:hypothetical protein